MTTTEILTVLTALGAATFGGALFAFSAFVMHALDRTPTPAAIEAMQQIPLPQNAYFVALQPITSADFLVVFGNVPFPCNRSASLPRGRPHHSH